ncbi:MAG: hypothetical protein LBT05_07140 [Planctomycetaceae bacterium]|nr:hypothetical protein [Planctomycetaceae bacterium]
MTSLFPAGQSRYGFPREAACSRRGGFGGGTSRKRRYASVAFFEKGVF